MNEIFEHMSVASRLMGAHVSPAALSSQTIRNQEGRPDLTSLTEVMKTYQLNVTLHKRALKSILEGTVPVVLVLKNNRFATIEKIYKTTDGSRVFCQRDLEGLVSEVLEADLLQDYVGYVWFVKRLTYVDRSSELPEYTLEKSWFWKVILRYRKYYIQVIFASILVNLLALVTSLYIMNVYDRVVPNKAFSTLWVLSIGVIVAMIFEYIARMVRGYLTDVAGKKSDLVISAALFRRAMSLDLSAKPLSSGSYANNLREFESVRDFMTSATLLAFVDLPFILLFVFVIFVVAGKLAIVPAIVIPALIIIAFLVQPMLGKLTADAMKEGSQRAGLSIEAIEGLETLKVNNATNWAQQKWEHYNAVSAKISMKLKLISAFIVNLFTTMQQMTTVFLVLYGTYLIHDEDPLARISMGALIAAVILSGRAIAPLAQVASLTTRFQQTKAALVGLDEIVNRPVDRDPTRSYISVRDVEGELSFNNVAYAYPGSETNTLHGINLVIKPGEKVGILGRIGSGKSTSLRLAAGLYQPKQGSVTLDGIDLRQIDPADLRNAVYLFSQQPRLFLGTLRENLDLGNYDRFSSDKELVMALKRFGVAQMVQKHPRGLDMTLGEDGAGLSGGQKQIVAMARMTLRNPQVVLLDEPTSGLDQGTENGALRALANWCEGRTLVVVTHRPQVLDIVDRVVVVDNGRVVMDGPKQQVLQALTQGSGKNAQKAEPKVTA